MKLNIKQLIQLVEQDRRGCLDAAQSGFREASISGLCGDEANVSAIGAIQSLDIDRLVKEAEL